MTRSRTPSTERPVVVTRCGQFLRVAPAGEWLGALRVVRRSGTADPVHGYAVRAEQVPLFALDPTPDGGPVAVVWAGLLPVVRGLAKRAGLTVRLAGAGPRPPGSRPPFDPPLDSDPVALNAIAGRERLLIRYGGRVDPARLIGQAVRADPDGRALVLVNTRAEASACRNVLKEYATDVALSIGRSLCDGRARVVVGLVNSIGMIPLGRMDRVFVVNALAGAWQDSLIALPDEPGTARTGPTRSVLERLASARRARLTGFLPATQTVSPFERARLLQAYGLDELVVTRPGHSIRPVRVLWAGAFGGRRPEAGWSKYRQKVSLVWGAGPRNRVLARLARALADGDRDALWSNFPDLAVGLSDRPGRRALAIVEGLDHAEHLARRLPGWRVVDGRSAGVNRPQGMTACTTESPAGVIATSLGLRRLRCDDFDVAVRGDGGPGEPPFPDGWLETSAAEPRELLLVDLFDRGGPWLASRTKARKRSYLAAGWCEVGVDPDLFALARFEATVGDRRGTR